MTQPPVAEPVPLQRRDDGTIHVANTRVTLDVVVEAFRSGATAEEIAQDYSSLNLADIYAVIAYYLRHEPEIENYLLHPDALARFVHKQASASSAAELREHFRQKYPGAFLEMVVFGVQVAQCAVLNGCRVVQREETFQNRRVVRRSRRRC